MIKCLLIEFMSGQTGKYLALGLGARTVRPSHSVNTEVHIMKCYASVMLKMGFVTEKKKI